MEEENLTKRERKKLNKQKKQVEEARGNLKSSMINKTIFLILILIGSVFLWYQFQPGEEGPDSANTNLTIDSVSESDHVTGNPESKVTVIEYGDFQCPACGSYYPLFKQIKENYGDRVLFAYRHFPLKSIHRHAVISSQASEAASLQGKFWEMHDILFERQKTWSNVRDPRSLFAEYANEIGLDVEKFEEDMNSSEIKKLVEDFYAQAIAQGLASTPSFVINGDIIDNPRDVEGFSKLLDDVLKATSMEETNDATESAETSE